MNVYHSRLHHLHHPAFEVFDGGVRVPYYETPSRAETVREALAGDARFDILPPEDLGILPILAIHDPGYIEFLQTSYARWQDVPTDYPKEALLPATFALRRDAPRPRSLLGAAGYHLMDLSVPITSGSWQAVYGSAQCALNAAQHTLATRQNTFALCRPPGHHAGGDYGGGYCFLNNAALAAQALTPLGQIALLDVDYHAGNGTQDIFYARADVFTQSIHADPNEEYPYYCGYEHETGIEAGAGYHQNYPLPPYTTDEDYLNTLAHALRRIREVQPAALVISLGVDTLGGDALGTFRISRAALAQVGAQLATLNLPTVIVLEGGYKTADLGDNVLAFLDSFA
jgi:acetoin utilization deacetylase AcuC-like enzyme